jgi:hypothetical protein
MGQGPFAHSRFHAELDEEALVGALGRSTIVRLRSGYVEDRYGMVLVPSHDANGSVDDLVAQRERDGWQLVSTRVDSEGAELIVFRRPDPEKAERQPRSMTTGSR